MSDAVSGEVNQSTQQVREEPGNGDAERREGERFLERERTTQEQGTN